MDKMDEVEEQGKVDDIDVVLPGKFLITKHKTILVCLYEKCGVEKHNFVRDLCFGSGHCVKHCLKQILVSCFVKEITEK